MTTMSAVSAIVCKALMMPPNRPNATAIALLQTATSAEDRPMTHAATIAMPPQSVDLARRQSRSELTAGLGSPLPLGDAQANASQNPVDPAPHSAIAAAVTTNVTEFERLRRANLAQMPCNRY